MENPPEKIYQYYLKNFAIHIVLELSMHPNAACKHKYSSMKAGNLVDA